METRGWSALALTAVLLAGCTSDSGDNVGGKPTPTPASPTVLDQSIRDFDFANAVWTDGFSRIPLVDGKATVPGDGYTTRFWLSSEPVYSDIDGDGAEDAAVALTDDGGGNAANTFWYVWLWSDGTAHQLDQWFLMHTRCGGVTDAVRGVDGGFEVLDALWDGSVSCADGKHAPVSYVVGLRDGFIVQIRPRLAPAEVCNPRTLTERVGVRPGVVAYLARDLSAPRLPEQAYRGALVRDWTYLALDEDWELVLLEGETERVCAWVRTGDLIL